MTIDLITDEEIQKLQEHIGKEVEITVHVSGTEWDYGDAKNYEYNARYKMILKNFSVESITGSSSEEKEYVGRTVKIGDPISQPFSAYSDPSLSLPWAGQSYSMITKIKHGDTVVYERMANNGDLFPKYSWDS